MNLRLHFILVIFFTIGVTNISVSQELKVIDSSSELRPSWITDVVYGYVIGMASGDNINYVQQAALLDVKQRIAQSIASNITVDIMQSSVTVKTNNSTQYEAESRDLVRSTTDKIPFLQSISLSEVSEFYWEKLSTKKKNGLVTYKYYIKYPFSSFKLQSLVNEFRAEQAHINNTIKQMEHELGIFSRVETIEKNMSALRALRPKLADNDARIIQIDELVNRYRAQYKNISIVEVEHYNKQIILKLTIDGRNISTAQIPTHRSSCADRITKQIDSNKIVITYDDYACRSGDDNWLEFTFKFGVNYISKRIHITK